MNRQNREKAIEAENLDEFLQSKQKILMSFAYLHGANLGSDHMNHYTAYIEHLRG